MTRQEDFDRIRDLIEQTTGVRMKQPAMSYDRDIRFVMRVIYGLLAANVFMIGRSVYTHHWVNAIAAALWAVNALVWRSVVKAQQRTRDESRIVHAAVQGVMERSR